MVKVNLLVKPTLWFSAKLYNHVLWSLNRHLALITSAPQGPDHVFTERKSYFSQVQRYSSYRPNWTSTWYLWVCWKIIQHVSPSTAPPACWSAGRLSAEPGAAPALTGFSPAKTGSSGPGWEAATGSCPSWCPSGCSGWHMAVCVATKTKVFFFFFKPPHRGTGSLTSLPHCYLHNSTTTESALAGMKPRRKTLRQPQL